MEKKISFKGLFIIILSLLLATNSYCQTKRNSTYKLNASNRYIYEKYKHSNHFIPFNDKQKEYDFLGTLINSPDATLVDFKAKGFTADNSYIQDFSVYKNDDWIRNQFKDPYGNFDEIALRRIYDASIVLYNVLVNSSFDELVDEVAEASITYGEYDIFAPREQRRSGPQFQEIEMDNPNHQIHGLITIGKVEDP